MAYFALLVVRCTWHYTPTLLFTPVPFPTTYDGCRYSTMRHKAFWRYASPNCSNLRMTSHSALAPVRLARSLSGHGPIPELERVCDRPTTLIKTGY